MQHEDYKQHNVDRGAVVCTCEVSDGEEHKPRNDVYHNVGRSERQVAGSICIGVLPVRHRLPELQKEAHHCHQEPESDQARVDPEPDGVVPFPASQGAGTEVAVIREKQVGDAEEYTWISVAGNRRRGSHCWELLACYNVAGSHNAQVFCLLCRNTHARCVAG